NNTEQAPAAIGTYSQAVKIGTTVYLSGQIPLVPATMEMVSDDFREQAVQVFNNLSAVCEAAGGELQDMVKVQIYLTDLGNFPIVNEVMAEYFARSEEHTSELQSRENLVCRLLLEKKNQNTNQNY